MTYDGQYQTPDHTWLLAHISKHIHNHSCNLLVSSFIVSDKLYAESWKGSYCISPLRLKTRYSFNSVHNHKLCIDIRYQSAQASIKLLTPLKAVSQQ